MDLLHCRLYQRVDGIRFVLKLLGSNEQAVFTSFIYGVTEPVVAPFRGMFPPQPSGAGVLEPYSLVTFMIYTILGWVLVQLVGLAGNR